MSTITTQLREPHIRVAIIGAVGDPTIAMYVRMNFTMKNSIFTLATASIRYQYLFTLLKS